MIGVGRRRSRNGGGGVSVIISSTPTSSTGDFVGVVVGQGAGLTVTITQGGNTRGTGTTTSGGNFTVSATGVAAGGFDVTVTGATVTGGGTVTIAGIASAFGALKSKLIAGQDAQLVVIGDSTGDETTEWVRQWPEQKISPRYPNLKVVYRLYDYTNNVWGNAVTIQEGTSGANGTLTVYNFSVGGTQPSYFAASRKSVFNGLSPDLVIWNHGHNTELTYLVRTYAVRVASSFLTGWETFRLLFPNCPHAAILQNPKQDDNSRAIVVSTETTKAGLYGDVTLIDVYSQFIADGKPASYYKDMASTKIHPSDLGEAIFIDKVDAAYIAAAPSPIAVAPAFLATATTNLLSNGDFSAWPGSVPTGWTANNGAVTAKETTNVDSVNGRTQCVALTGNATNSRITQAFTAAARTAIGTAGSLTFAARVMRPTPNSSGSTAIIGVTLISASVGTISSPTGVGVLQDGGWVWVVTTIEGVPNDLTYANLEIYWDSAATAGAVAYIDRVIAVAGVLPRSM